MEDDDFVPIPLSFLKRFRWLVKIEEILFYPKLFWDRPEGSKHFGFETGDFIASEPKYS